MKLRFGPFVLDEEARQLVGAAGALHLSPKAFDLLAALARHRPNALSKADLQQQLWPDTFVSEANLSNLVAEIRQALGDSSNQSRYVRTVHRFGYAFCADALPASPEALRRPFAPCWIEWGTQRFPLRCGEQVIGRDPDVEIRLDLPTVSRRHARIVISERGAVLEDFGSKNGTYVGADRVEAAVDLADGDDIRIGTQLIRFHVRDAESTETLVEPR